MVVLMRKRVSFEFGDEWINIQTKSKNCEEIMTFFSNTQVFVGFLFMSCFIMGADYVSCRNPPYV